jgi:L-rhamnose mutarotase
MDIFIAPSKNPTKKWTAFVGDKRIHFGASGYSDYTIHKDAERMHRYLRRHSSRENWADINSAGFWSRWLLWNKPTLIGSANDIKKRFGIRIKFIQVS